MGFTGDPQEWPVIQTGRWGNDEEEGVRIIFMGERGAQTRSRRDESGKAGGKQREEQAGDSGGRKEEQVWGVQVTLWSYRSPECEGTIVDQKQAMEDLEGRAAEPGMYLVTKKRVAEASLS